MATGGDTAYAICDALETEAVRILGELEVGIPYGSLIGGLAPDLLLITKGGGVGCAKTLVNAIEQLKSV